MDDIADVMHAASGRPVEHQRAVSIDVDRHADDRLATVDLDANRLTNRGRRCDPAGAKRFGVERERLVDEPHDIANERNSVDRGRGLPARSGRQMFVDRGRVLGHPFGPVALPVRVNPNADHDCAVASLGQHARCLATGEQQVVGPLQLTRHDRPGRHRCGRRERDRADRPERTNPALVPNQERHEHTRLAGSGPHTVPATTPGGLQIGDEHLLRSPLRGQREQVGIGRAGLGDPPDSVEARGPSNVSKKCDSQRFGIGRHIWQAMPVFSKVLVANRGEIAVRVIRACRDLGVTSVAVYSELDRDALHVRLADEAYALGGQTAAESYLNTEKILEILAECGADGLHPGYGFFSENADFARAVTDAGVTFIGPRPEAIEVMGDKLSARAAAENVGVSGVPGNTDAVTEPAQVEAFAAEHGYPVAIKAAFGGGGRGMKVVNEGDDIAAAIDGASREAVNYFGRGELYLERYLSQPRHVEVQVLADSHGNCIHLGTRDCSAQRRHQKLIEEAPAAGIDPEILAAMGEAAVTVAKGCDYVNAGTVEFLYEDGGFYYLEMNTRLQVEHPVTELVTGIDLVEAQLRVASGEELWMTQDDIAIEGHAIEVRINAEDPAGGKFLPAPGKITSLKAPGGFGTRFDTGYDSGDEISQFYDNLVGKLVCWGHDRPTAIGRTLRALDELVVDGVATTIPADIAILAHDDFGELRHSTKWVEETLDLSDVRADVAPVVDDEEGPRIRRDVPVEVNGRRFDVSVWVPESAGVAAAGGGGAAPARRRAASGGSGGGGNGQIAVPMQGTVVKVEVEVGQSVEAGDTVLVLEAMKMENNIAADIAGTVTEVRVAVGDSVGGGDVVVVIEA